MAGIKKITDFNLLDMKLQCVILENGKEFILDTKSLQELFKIAKKFVDKNYDEYKVNIAESIGKELYGYETDMITEILICILEKREFNELNIDEKTIYLKTISNIMSLVKKGISKELHDNKNIL